MRDATAHCAAAPSKASGEGGGADVAGRPDAATSGASFRGRAGATGASPTLLPPTRCRAIDGSWPTCGAAPRTRCGARRGSCTRVLLAPGGVSDERAHGGACELALASPLGDSPDCPSRCWWLDATHARTVQHPSRARPPTRRARQRPHGFRCVTVSQRKRRPRRPGTLGGVRRRSSPAAGVHPTIAKLPQVCRLGCGGARPCCARAESGVGSYLKGGSDASTPSNARRTGCGANGCWGRASATPLRVTCPPRRCPPPTTPTPLHGRLACLLPCLAGAAVARLRRCWPVTPVAQGPCSTCAHTLAVAFATLGARRTTSDHVHG